LDTRLKILNSFKTSTGNIKKLMDEEDGTKMVVFGIKQVDTKFGKNYILLVSKNKIDNTKPNILSNVELYTIWGNKYICEFIEKHISEFPKIDGLSYFDTKENVYGSSLELPLFGFIKEGIYYTASRNKCPKIKIIQASIDKMEEDRIEATLDNRRNIINKIDSNASDKTIKRTLYLKECKPMDIVLKEGDTFIIKEYWKQKKSILLKIQINDEDEDIGIIANPWLNDYANKYILEDKLPIIALVVGIKKRHPVAKDSCFCIVGEKDYEIVENSI
jgi:hypothetical protein